MRIFFRTTPQLLKFTTDVEHFLEEYDRVVEHRHVHRRNFARHFQEIETNLQLLISKFHRIGADGCRNQLFMELFCCGTLFENRDELREHYFRFHNTPRLLRPSIVEVSFDRKGVFETWNINAFWFSVGIRIWKDGIFSKALGGVFALWQGVQRCSVGKSAETIEKCKPYYRA